MKHYQCIYRKNKNGMGGVATTIDGEQSFTISVSQEQFALDKDEVLVSKVNDKHEGHGVITKITKHNTDSLKGFLQKYKDKFLLRVTDHKFGNYLVIIKSAIKKFDRENLYNAMITSYPNESQPYFEAMLTNQIIDKLDDDQHFIQKLLDESKTTTVFSKQALTQANIIKEEISKTEIKKRHDLRDIPFVTIDGSDAKDYDDAVYCENVDGVFQLYVAIADVSHFVTQDSPLDHDSYDRGTSIYMPKQVIPMLPEKLSNGVCSLKPNVDRLAMCCQMKIDQNGKILDYTIYNGVINSKARLTYDQVEKWINTLEKAPPELISNISNLYLVYKALHHSRGHRGAIEFEAASPTFIFDEHGLVSEIRPQIRLESHKLIEECMLAANVCVADYLIAHAQPGLFRIHPKPSEEKFSDLKAYLKSLAIPFEVKYATLTPHHYSELLKRVKDHPNYPAIQQAVLRSMQLALYSPDNIGHFGLSYDKYLHFTSPIRRYPDLLVHRAVKKTLEKGAYNYARVLRVIGEHTSFTERRAEDLSRKMDAYYKCQYAKMHIGKVFSGISTSIVSFGIFIYIPDLMLDGLLHISELGSDYYIYDEIKRVLVGKNRGKSYKVGQEFTVEIESVDMVRQYIDFKFANNSK